MSKLGNVAVREDPGAEVIRRRINFVEGANVTITIADDSPGDEVDVTIASAGAAATAWIKHFYPAVNPDHYYGTYASVLMGDGIDTTVRQTFLIPEDILTITRAFVVVIPEAGGNIRRSVATNFAAACTETYQTHTDSIAAGQVAVNINQITCLDFSAALTVAVGYDMVGVEFTREASDVLDTVDADVHYLGIIIIGEV